MGIAKSTLRLSPFLSLKEREKGTSQREQRLNACHDILDAAELASLAGIRQPTSSMKYKESHFQSVSSGLKSLENDKV